MAKTKAQNIMYEISEILYRHGKYGIERIAIICEILNDSMFSENKNVKLSLEFLSNKFSFLLIDDVKKLKEHFNNLIKEKHSDIANAIRQLVNNNLKNTEIIPTDDFSVKIMQSFAKKLQEGNAFIDPCVGTGRLLEGLKADKYFGFDINLNATKIAKTYINLTNNIFETKAYFDCLPENFLYRKIGLIHNISNPTFIFDPPLNDSIEMNPMIQEHLYRNGIYSYGGKIPSEYAFLAQILFGTYIEKSNYVCVFTSNFLFAQDKFKTSFRKYLLDNSLIAIIQSNFSEKSSIQKLILVGKNRLETPQHNLRYFITFKDKDISEQNISKIAQKCLNNETFNEKEFYDIAKIQAYTLEEIKENDYQISMPQYYENEINPTKIDSLVEISNKLQKIGKSLIQSNNRLQLYINNLLSGTKNIKSNEDIDGKTDNDKEQKNWFDYPYSDLNNAIGIFSDDKEIDWTPIDFIDKNYIDIEVLDSCIYNLRQLFNAKRLRYKNNKLEIYSKKDLPTYRASEPFSSYIIKSNNKDQFYKKITSNLSSRQLEFLNTYIKYYFDYDDENEGSEENKKLILSFEQFSTSEKHSNIATLKTLGLL